MTTMNGTWAWLITLGTWAGVLWLTSFLFTWDEGLQFWLLVIFWLVVICAAVYGTYLFLHYYDAWPFIPQ